jgi:hypothetical protein
MLKTAQTFFNKFFIYTVDERNHGMFSRMTFATAKLEFA